jgi:hypothetical protein
VASPRLLLLVLCAIVAVAGIILGAATQKESFLQERGAKRTDPEVAGNLITLTASLTALGVTGGAMLVSRRSVRAGLLPAAGLFATTYLLVWMMQSAFPNYIAIETARTADLSINPVLANSAGFGSAANPGVMLSVLSLLCAGLLGFAWSARLLLGRGEQGPADSRTILGWSVAAFALALPFLAVGIAAHVRLIIELPASVRVGLYHLLLPIQALAFLGLMVCQSVKVQQLAACVRNPHLRIASEEAWATVARAERIMAGVVVACSAVAFLAPRIELASLHAGLTFGLTTRAYTVLHALVLLPLAAGWLVHREAMRSFAEPPVGAAQANGRTAPLLVVGQALALVGALVGAFFLAGALWAWLFAFAPAVWLAMQRPGLASVPTLLLAAAVTWGIGNTVAASYASTEAQLQYDVGPGVLALWRLLAVIILGIAVVRGLRAVATQTRPSLLWPLSLAAAFSAGALVLLELPLHAWVQIGTTYGQEVALGSVVGSQDAIIRFIMHALAVGCAITLAISCAYLMRADWFQPPAEPLAAKRRAKVSN